MKVIEVAVGYPEWIGIFIPIVAVFVTVILIGAVLVANSSGDNEIIGLGLMFAAIIALIALAVCGVSHGYVSPEERVRVASEVSDVVGFDVSLEDVDRMFHEKPVEDIYYVRDGHSLVIEENE